MLSRRANVAHLLADCRDCRVDVLMRLEEVGILFAIERWLKQSGIVPRTSFSTAAIDEPPAGHGWLPEKGGLLCCAGPLLAET